MMVQQGWSEGQSLGNRSSSHLAVNDADRLAAARVGILFKDNNLGLGAKTKSKDIEGQRTGLDAFQAMLGRLNGKSDKEVEAMEKKVEDRKLEMYAKGRWGGMVFVKGGTLVGEKTFGTGEEIEPANVNESRDQSGESQDSDTGVAKDTEKQKRKEEKKQRKEARRIRREAKAAKKAAKSAKRQAKSQQSSSEDDQSEDEKDQQHLSSCTSAHTLAPDEPVSSASSGNEDSTSSNLKRKRSVTTTTPLPVKTAIPTPVKGGRHLLRGRNIQAKRMAFSDMKGLDEIFMKTG